MSFEIVTGDLLESKETIIMQQCCCTATKAHGLSLLIANKLKVNVYSSRRAIGNRNCAILEDRPKTGTCSLVLIPNTNDKKQYVASLFGQYAMGIPGKYHQDHKIPDTSKDREIYFKESLEHLYKLCEKNKEIFKHDIYDIAAPFKIGCGLAGGKWENYVLMLNEWLQNHPKIKLKIYKLD